MDPDRESRMRQLEDAVEAYLQRGASGEPEAVVPDDPVSELLRPMLAPPLGEEQGTVLPRIGELELRREIGRGGMGIVYQAEDRRLKRQVAVKVMRRSPGTPASAIVRFWREAEVGSTLRHPGVVRVHTVGETDDAFFLVMDLERAASLAEVIAELRQDGGPAPAPDALAAAARAAATRKFPGPADPAPPASARSHAHAAAAVIVQVADALAHAHEHGIVHRDVKPANVLLGADGRALLTDFGLARALDAPGVTLSGDMPGTPHYMAPEQARGERHAIGPATDVFALGVTLYELLTLRRAFAGDTTPAVLLDVVHREPPDPRRINRSVPRDVVAIVQKAMEKDPARRYPSARAMSADLHAFLRGEPVRARPIAPPRRLLRWAVREPWRALAAGLLVCGVPTLAILGTAALRREPQTAAGARVLHEQWVDATMADGFREAGEGDHEAARALFDSIVRAEPGREEGLAGLSVVARRSGDQEGLAVLTADPGALAASSALRRRQATLLRRLGRARDAEAASHGLAEPPIGFDAFLHGYHHVELGHTGHAEAWPEAARLLHRAVVTSDRARPAFSYEWLHAAAHAGDRDAADAAIAAIERLWPDRATSWFWIAFARDESGDTEAAIAALRRAVAIDGDFATAVVNLARLSRRVGRPADALAVLRACSERHPDSVELRIELARTLHGLHQLDDSAAHYRWALDRRPNDVEVRRELAGVLADAGHGAEAAALAEIVLARHPGDTIARLSLAVALVKLGRSREAIPHLQACTAATPTARPWFLLGSVRAELGDHEGARAAYERVLLLEPDHTFAAVNLANILLRTGDTAAAVPLLQRALAIDPDLVNARRALLRALSATPQEAVAACRAWIARSPELAEPWRHLGWYLLQVDAGGGSAERHAEALAAARKAIALQGSEDGPTLHVLGAALLARGNAAEAKATVEKALSLLSPQDRFTPYYREQMQQTLRACEAALAGAGKR